MNAEISLLKLPQLGDLIERKFEKALMEVPQVLKNSSIVVKEPMPMNTGLFKRFAERITTDTYSNVRPEGADSAVAKVQYGYEKDLVIIPRTKQISITKLMRDAGKNREIKDLISILVNTIPNGIELDLSHRLSFAWSTSYTDRDGQAIDTTVGDGLALISNVHTLTGSATTYSNQIPSNPAFSKTALIAAEKLVIEQTYDNMWVKKILNFNTIITTDDPDTCIAVKELLNASADVSTSNSGTFNFYKSAYIHLKLPLIATDKNGWVDTTKRKYWFLASSEASDFYYSELNAPYIVRPEDANGKDISSENWTYLTGGSYGITIVSGRWIKGSKWDAS